MAELTSRQRAKLRGMANTMETILYIGKEGITEGIVKEAYDALEARELIKCSVQNGCELSAKEACQALCERTHAQPVQCIGKRFVLYRESRDNKRISIN
jgi:RNA-binding protein